MKRVDDFVEAIPFLIGCAFRFGEPIAGFFNGLFEMSDSAI